MLSAEAWVGIVGLAVTVCGGMVAWMFAIHSKLASIAESLKSIPKLWDKVDKHETRLNGHELAIESIKQSHDLVLEAIRDKRRE